MNKKQLASQETIRKILKLARKKFSNKGYTDTSLEEIVEELGMTRGALYHHFKNKKALFLAVLEEVQSELGQHVEASALKVSDTWQQLTEGCLAFVLFANRKENRRILLTDGPNVVEWEEWRGQDAENSLYHLKEQLEFLQKEDKIISLDLDVMAHMISGALNDLALYLAAQKNIQEANLRLAVESLLRGFGKHG
ncbi:TetR/AcrR family transcriptional regulator [Streptococcus panodentis]|uniref:TetR/AcrR family transcriptional regulator n=1 Tax=Streptococcus panodentis TaxID=1581472 RepID=A0ABS5AVP4_9STRE|nr:TetR/AcrR family transcriptional regulator [Streptococcus panodentis]MBP2620642.1 TetR/AcrR family transcriptional regulator [Streptococcus panodentis]